MDFHVRGVLFDMDGTLTRPTLDFDAIRRDIGLPPGRAILEAMDELSPADRAEAERVLHRHEQADAEASELDPACHDVLQELGRRGLPFAVITRNSRMVVETVWRVHGLPPCPTIARDDGLPFKPDPTPLHIAAERIGRRCSECLMVGDSVFDIAAGNAAGCVSVWISHGDDRPFDDEPAVTISSLGELLRHL
ncbi:MAG: HAD family hydrolase [Planctomycetota bacterium]